MEAREFRIGNYVYGDDDRIVTITGAHLSDDTSDWADGIILTEDIFLKAGFEKRALGYQGSHVEFTLYTEYCYITIKAENGEFFLDNGEGVYLTRKPFEYLHQLQNLYFALTGEELTVNF